MNDNDVDDVEDADVDVGDEDGYDDDGCEVGDGDENEKGE